MESQLSPPPHPPTTWVMCNTLKLEGLCSLLGHSERQAVGWDEHWLGAWETRTLLTAAQTLPLLLSGAPPGNHITLCTSPCVLPSPC